MESLENEVALLFGSTIILLAMIFVLALVMDSVRWSIQRLWKRFKKDE